jgi:hypothetical protein
MNTTTNPSRKAMRDALKDQSIQSILRVPKSKLTAKQARFAEEVAKGETKSGAYRKAYDTKAKPKDVANTAYKLAHRSDIASTIDAIKLANDAMKYQNAEALRSLAITSLVSVLTDPDAKHAIKVQASKVIGQITEVSLFTHRSETKVIHSSEDLRAKILREIQSLMNESAIDVVENDATTLLEELSTNVVISEDFDPTGDPSPTFSESGALDSLHTIPHERSPENQNVNVYIPTDPPLVDGDTPLIK